MKTRNLKTIVSLLMVSLLAFSVLTACSTTDTQEGDVAPDPDADQSESQAPEAEVIEIDFWHHYNEQSPENQTLNEVLIPAFEAENPGIKVNAVSHEWAELHDKLLTSIEAKQLPDVARLDIAWVPELESYDVLVALDEAMGDFSEVQGALAPAPASTALVQGHYYGLPLNTNTKILFYNKDLLDAAGKSVPQTLDEFFETAKALTGEKDGQMVWGYGEPALAGWNICPLIWSNGGAITDEDCTVATGYVNSPATVEIIQKLADAYQEGTMAGFSDGDIPMTDGYGTGRYAMIFDGPWKFAELSGAYPDFTAYTAQTPAGPGGSVGVLGGEDIAMFTNADQDAAWAFMKFMTSPFAQIEMAKVGQIPVNLEAIDSEDVKAIETFAPFLTAIKTAKARPQVKNWTEIDGQLTRLVELAVLGEKTPQEAMDEAAEIIDGLLAEANK